MLCGAVSVGFARGRQRWGDQVDGVCLRLGVCLRPDLRELLPVVGVNDLVAVAGEQGGNDLGFHVD